LVACARAVRAVNDDELTPSHFLKLKKESVDPDLENVFGVVPDKIFQDYEDD
jgi:hypothetical protein